MTIRPALLAATAAVAVVSLAACGGSSANTATGNQPTGQATSQASGSGSGSGSGQGAGGFAGRNPGTSGKIAAISGKTLQVQNQTDGQVAVSYTAKTAITAQVAASLADVKVGSCVTVTPVVSASGVTSAKPSTGSTGSTGPLAAGNVRISQPTNGSCLGGLGGMRPGGAGGSASGSASGRPSGFPTKVPSGFGSGGPGGGRSFVFGANGKVTAVSATGFTVASQFPGTSSQAPRDTTVTVSGSTTYTTTKPGTAAALKVGKCVTATGASDDTGAVAADRLVVSDPVDGTCTGGFMIRQGAAGGTGQGGTGTSDGGAA